MDKEKKLNIRDCNNRSSCALTNTLDIIGDKWTLLIIRDMFFVGKKQFSDFLESPEKISTNILTSRLKKLEKYEIIQKHAYQKNPVRYEYSLTEIGLELGPVILAIAGWGLTHIEDTFKPTDEQLKEMREYYDRKR